MRTSPAPTRGAVLADRDRPARALRISAHPEAALVVLSVWDGSRCITTVRLAPQDVPDLLKALSAASVITATGAVLAATA